MSTLKEIVFIDRNVTDLNTLLAGMRPDVDAVLLTDAEPAIVQIARVVHERKELAAIHIIAHGYMGEINFCAGTFSVETLNEYSADLANIGQTLAKGGNVLLWSCHTGAGERGASFINTLAQKLGTAVAAATDLVGAAVLGGCWELQIGAVTARVPLTVEGMAGYGGVMATFDGTSGNDKADTTALTQGTGLIGFANGTWAQLTDGAGDSLVGNQGDDTVVAAGGNDTINGGSGADSLNGASGSDTYLFIANDVVSGEVINDTGSSGIDTLQLNNSVDFTAATQIAGIEGLTFTGTQTATFNASQFGSGKISNALVVTGSSNTQIITINNASNFSVANWTFPIWSTSSDSLTINDTSGDDTITGSASSKETVSFANNGNNTYIATVDDNLVDSIVGGSGIDTADYSNYTNAITVTLNTSASATVNGAGNSNDDTIRNIENFIGGSGNDSITGDSAANSLTGSGGADTLASGTGADTLTGGTGIDSFSFSAGDSRLTIAGSGSNGTISGYDVITDMESSEILSFINSTTVAANVTAFDGTNSSLQLHTNNAVSSHRITNGIITFDDTGTFSSAVSLTSLADVSAVVQYLQNNQSNIGGGKAVAFTATISGTNHTYVFRQYNGSGTSGDSINDVLIDLVDKTASNLTANSSQLSLTFNPTVSSVTYGSNDGALASGESVPLIVNFSAAVTVAGGTPTLSLNSGGTATYLSGSGTTSLTFTYTPTATQSTADLTVTAVNLNSATIRNLSGDDADTTGAIINPTGTLVVDTTAPSLPGITSVTDDQGSITGSVANNGRTDDTALVVRVSLTSTNAVSGDTVQLYNSGATLNVATILTGANITNGYVDITTPTLSNGSSYVLTAKVIDIAGNISSASTSHAITVDTTAPLLPTITNITDDQGNITGPVANNGRTDDTALVVRVSLASTNAVSGDSVQLYNSGAALNGATALTGANITNGYVDITTPTLSNGSNYVLTAKVIDIAGNASSASISSTFTVDTTAPTATCVTTGTIQDSASATVKSSETGTAYLVNSSLAVTNLASITNAASDLWNSVAIVAANTNTSLAATLLSSGIYKVYTVDVAGNFSLPSSSSVTVVSNFSASVTADTIQNTANTIVQSNRTGTVYLVSSTIAVTTLADITSANGDLWNSVAIAATNVDTLLAATGLVDGTYKAYAVDTQGNMSVASTNLVIVDTTAPNAPATPNLLSSSDTGSLNWDEITNVTTPTFSGTAETNSTVTIYDGATLVGTGTATGGSYSIATSVLANSVHTLTAKATDVAGNVSTTSGSLSVTIDTSVSAPSTPDLATASDTGVSSTDNITKNATITLTGTAEASSTVTIYDTNGTTVVGTDTATGGNYSITTSALNNGIHSLTAKTTDIAGNISAASSGLSVTIDAVTPSVSSVAITSASGIQNNTVNAGDVISISIVMSEATLVTGTPQLALNIGGSTVQADYASGSGSSTLVFTYTILAGQTDANGISLASNSLTLNGGTLSDAAGNTATLTHALVADNTGYLVDTTAPNAPAIPDLATASDTGASSTDDITKNTAITFTGTAETGSTVTIYDTNGTTVLGTGTATGGNYSITTSALSSGVHTLTAKAADAAGNTGTASSGLSVTIDTSVLPLPSKPDLAAASDTGSSSTDNITKNATITLTGTAETDSTVTIYDTNGTTVLGTGTATGGNYSIITSALSDSVHTLTAKATDIAGNISVASTSLAVTIDTLAPTATCVTASTTTVQDTGSAAVKSTETGTAYLVNNTVTVTNLASITGAADNLWNSVAIGVVNTSTLLAAVGLSSGTYKVYTTDVAGNLSAVSSSSVPVNSNFTASVTAATIQNTANATVQSSRVGTAYLVKSTVTVTTEASITSAADSLWNSVAVTAANTNTALSATGLIDGSYKVYVVDTNNNLSVSSTNSVTVDTTPPIATLVSATINDTANASAKSSEVGTAYLVNSTVNVTTVASITGIDTSLWNTVAITAANTSTNLAAAGLQLGSYKLYTTDAAGNLSTASTASVSVADTTAPVASVNTATMQSTVNASVQSTEVGTAYLVKSTVTVSNLTSITSAADSSWNSVAIPAPNSSTLLAATGLADGTYKVYATDASGNLSTASINSVTVDNTAPTATVTAANLQSTAKATVQSTEPGTAYLVKDVNLNDGSAYVSVTHLTSSITTADGSLWNSVAITTANSNTLLPATRLANGTYHVYTVDKAGNVSLASNNAVTVYTPAIDITDLGNTSFTINGESQEGLSGVSVASAGDVNGDGLDDLIIGGSNSDSSAGNWASRSYVVFGQTATTAVDLSAITAGTGGFVINGTVAHDMGGVSVASAGDINADGLADLIVGDTVGAYTSLNPNGHSYVIFGKTSTTAVDLSSLGAGGFVINGQANGDQSGFSVASAGDVNGDGLPDLIVGAIGAGAWAGSSYVVFGRTNTADTTAIDLSSIALGTGGFIINGQAADDSSGISVASAGDVNGDGLADVIVGALYSDPATSVDAGRSYVVFGKANTTAVDLSTIAAGTGSGFVINGQAAGDLSGYSVASAGDVNGDGLADVIVGALYSDPTSGIDAGRSYVVFGKAGTTAVDLSVLGTGGFVINGQTAGDQSGISVASAGDFNGDGLADLLIGAYQATPSSTRAYAGRSYLVFGKTTATAVELSAVANGTGGFVINGDNKDDYSGLSVAAAGDVNADGYADLIIGAPQNDAIATDAGRSYVIFGSNSSLFGLTTVDQFGTANADTLTGTVASETIIAKGGNDTVIGGGGADVLYGGGGGDRFELSSDNVAKLALGVTNSNLARINGGSGIDTLVLSGTGITLDLTAINNQMTGSRIESVERIDLNVNSSNNSLKLAATDILDMSDMNHFNSGSGWAGLGASVGRHQLVVDGGWGNSVTVLGAWTAQGTATNSSITYNVYNSASTLAQLLVTSNFILRDLLTGTSGNDTLTGLAGSDTIDGLGGDDTITGGIGKDTITTGAGNDTVVFATADINDAPGNGYDLYTDLTLNGSLTDKIDLPVTVANIGTAVSGTINQAAFASSMNTLLTQSGLGFATHAGTIEAAIVTDGTSKYLAVDMNGNDQFDYASGSTDDLLIQLTGTSVVTSLTTGTFI